MSCTVLIDGTAVNGQQNELIGAIPLEINEYSREIGIERASGGVKR